jgi:nucleotide-binding universal stress UspA family protein
MMRILVPTDFSTHSLAALAQAVQYTQAVGGELLLLHVVEGEPLRWYAVDGLPEAPSARLEPMAQLVLPQTPQKRVSRDLCAEAEWKLAALLPPPAGPVSRPGDGRPGGGGDRPRRARAGS